MGSINAHGNASRVLIPSSKNRILFSLGIFGQPSNLTHRSSITGALRFTRRFRNSHAYECWWINTTQLKLEWFPAYDANQDFIQLLLKYQQIYFSKLTAYVIKPNATKESNSNFSNLLAYHLNFGRDSANIIARNSKRNIQDNLSLQTFGTIHDL